MFLVSPEWEAFCRAWCNICTGQKSFFFVPTRPLIKLHIILINIYIIIPVSMFTIKGNIIFWYLSGGIFSEFESLCFIFYKKLHITFYSKCVHRNTIWIESLHTCMYQRVKDSKGSSQWVLNKYSSPWIMVHSTLF